MACNTKIENLKFIKRRLMAEVTDLISMFSKAADKMLESDPDYFHAMLGKGIEEFLTAHEEGKTEFEITILNPMTVVEETHVIPIASLRNDFKEQYDKILKNSKSFHATWKKLEK